MSRAGPLLTGSRLTYSFDIFLKFRSYGSGSSRLGEISPERSEISPLTGSYERIKLVSPAKPDWECRATHAHVSRVNFKMKNR